MNKLSLVIVIVGAIWSNGVIWVEAQQAGYNYPRPGQTLGSSGTGGLSGTTPGRPFSPNVPTASGFSPANDPFGTTIGLATTPSYSGTGGGYPSGRPSAPGLGAPSGPGVFPPAGSGITGRPQIGFDEIPGTGVGGAFSGTGPSSRPGLAPGVVGSPGTSPSAAFPGSTGPGFGGGQFPGSGPSTIARPGSIPSTSAGGQPGFGGRPGTGGQPGFGGQPGQQGFGGQPGQQGGGSSGNNGQYEGGDYSAIPGEPGVDYPIYTEIPQTSFDCINQQWPGYYADVEAQCQVFHICALNKTFNFLCPNGTIFSQETLVCVWWNQFDCSTAPSLYGNNAYIYDYSKTGQQSTQQQSPVGPSANYPGSQGPVGPSVTYPGSQVGGVPAAPTGPTAVFGGNQGPTGPSTTFGGNQGPTGPNAVFGGNQGPTGPSTTFGGNQGPTGPNAVFGGSQGPTGPSTTFGGNQGPTGPNAVFGGNQGPTGPSTTFGGNQGGPTASYPGQQVPTPAFPGPSTAGYPNSVGPTPAFPSAPSGAYPPAGYPSGAPNLGFPANDPVFPSAQPPNREYLPPTRL